MANKFFNRAQGSFAAFTGVACLWLGAAPAATLGDSKAVAGPVPMARITEANYCFARVRGLDPSRLPPAYLVLKLKISVIYRNTGTRPLILPLEYERTVYDALKPGVMKIFQEPPGGLLVPTLKPLKELPVNVNPESPIDPKNDVFAVIPARGDFALPPMEEIVMPVNHQTLFRHYPDLRGHKLYLRLQLGHQKLDPALESALSDRWNRFGVPWTGTMLSNVMTINVPQVPTASGPCVDGPAENPGNHAQDTGK
jgi:hypothetical protein